MGNAYNKLNSKISGTGEQINEAWLDEKIKQGNDFVLSKNPSEAKPDSSYGMEIKKLKANGYTIPDKPSSDGLFHVVKGGK